MYFIYVLHWLSINCCYFHPRSLYGEEARKLPERTNEMAGVYASQCIELAREMNIHCIDIWSKMQETAGWQKLYLRYCFMFSFFFLFVMHSID